MEARIKWSPRFMANMEQTFGKGGELQQYIDTTILESIEPYLPFDSGELRNSGIRNTTIGSGVIRWQTDYVRYLYHGILMVDPKTKVAGFLTKDGWKSRKGITKILDPMGRELKFRGGGKRGAHWPENWMRDNLVKFESDLQRKAGELIRR